MLLCELIVRQTPQGFSLVRIHLKCNLFSPRNQSNTAIRDNYPSENLKTKFKFKAASKKKPDNKHSECTTLICNFHYYLSQYGKCYIHTYYAGTLKSISNLNVKGWRKIILKTYLQAVFFLLSPEMDAGFIFNEEYNCIFEWYTRTLQLSSNNIYLYKKNCQFIPPL